MKTHTFAPLLIGAMAAFIAQAAETPDNATKTTQSASTAMDAKSLTGASTPLQTEKYGTRNFSAPVLVGKKHNPANYKPAPKVPAWQFATTDPTNEVLTFERQPAPANGWHTFSRKGKVVLSGGSSAAANRVYTVFNPQQLISAIKEAGNDPKIIRVVGHIDLRWSENNTKFLEYTSYSDQKFGGTISIPSNTTLVGINDAQGRPARITGTTLQIGNELALAAEGEPEADFKQWVASGKDPEDYPTWTRNILVRNLAIDTPWDVNPEGSGDAYADGIIIARGQNIWIDHVTITDGDTPDSLSDDTRHDGALDVVRGSDYVTISNSYFGKHGKVTLVGNGDAGRAWSDAGRLHVTFNGNWWDSLHSRLPLNRYGQVHVFNNLITGNTSTKDKDVKFGSGLDARHQSNMLVQNNYYQFTGLKPREFCGKVIKGEDYIGFRSSGHLFISDRADKGAWVGGPVEMDGMCGMTPPSEADAWMPPYAHTLKTAADTNTSVRENAGAGKLR
jgi:pectate lyase